MTLTLPYRRIARPFNNPNGSYIDCDIQNCYLTDHDYAPDRTSAIRSYHEIERDFLRIFEYIEPHDSNLHTYSTRLYEVFLRAATEFESHSKAILEANSYVRSGDWKMSDYKKIDNATLLSSYKIKLPIWSGSPKILQPFAPWAYGRSLSWYQNYNTVKHNRATEFAKANFANTLESVAALFVILYAQFNLLSFSPFEVVWINHTDDHWISHRDSVFSIQLPTTWKLEQCYGFDSTNLSQLNPKFAVFRFS